MGFSDRQKTLAGDDESPLAWRAWATDASEQSGPVTSSGFESTQSLTPSLMAS